MQLQIRIYLLGLTIQDRREIEYLIGLSIKNIRIHTTLARNMVPKQANIEEFTYGLICGMILGSFIERFTKKNDRQLDKDEMTDLFFVMMRKMPYLRKAIMNELGSM